MNKTDLKRFAGQLLVWAELVIEHGRTPFRRVDLFPSLHSRQGQIQPPLVFWINRQSMMAGGVILLPDNDLPQQLNLGCAAADALGLQHFVTWESARIRIWNATETPPGEEKQFAVTTGEDPETFRALLLEVMEQLKLLSVLGMVPAKDLSPSYLHNLFQETLDSALDPLITSFRQTRAEGGLQETTRADSQAEQLNRVTLIRLLALLWHDRLPDSILPEKLERAMELAVPSLPPELYHPLAFPKEKREPSLPTDSAVCYHHLQVRLRQIGWNSPQERAVQAINQLLTPIDTKIDPVFDSSEASEPLLQINPVTPLLGHAELYELSDSPSFLAAAALLRNINDLPPVQQYSGTLFNFIAASLPASRIQAKLVNRRKVPRDELKRAHALLRTSWPTRRFKFPSDTPHWMLEAVHLLGLSPAGANLQLEVPTIWLTTAFGETIWELIIDSFHLQAVSLGEGTTTLKLWKQKPISTVTTVRSAAEERQIDWNEYPHPCRSLLLFSLFLTTEQYLLLVSDQFKVEISTSPTTDAGLQAYSRTTLGRCLWHMITDDQIPQAATELRLLGAEHGWPVPVDDIIYELGLSGSSGAEKPIPSEELDHRLADLLDSSVPLNIVCPQIPQLHESPSTNSVATSVNHREVILNHLKACGLPNFPEQYLYQLEKPQLITYNFQPPLQIVSELLGEFELMDADQKHFSVHWEATVEALQLCADQGCSEVELPVDQQQLNDIIISYRNDLRQLRQELTRQTHTRLERPQAAERLAKKLWQELKLPSWKWLDH